MQSWRGPDVGVPFSPGHICLGITPAGRCGRAGALEGRALREDESAPGEFQNGCCPSPPVGSMQGFSSVLSLTLRWGCWQCTQERVGVPEDWGSREFPHPARGCGGGRDSSLEGREGCLIAAPAEASAPGSRESLCPPVSPVCVGTLCRVTSGLRWTEQLLVSLCSAFLL